MTWQDWLQLVAALVSALAAVGAIIFAWLTVKQAKDLRREDRRARLGELVGDYSADLLRAVHGKMESNATLPVSRARLAAAVASAKEPLRACEALLGLDKDANPDVVQLQTALAVDELASVDPVAKARESAES